MWDAQNQVVLLDSTDVKDPRNITFSPDGHFFVCGTKGPEFYLWKKSPDGYLHQKITSSGGSAIPVISPNGELILSVGSSVLQLWHTTSSPTPLPTSSPTPLSTGSPTSLLTGSPTSLPTGSPTSPQIQPSLHTNDFLLEFSPDGLLVAVAQRLGNTITVIDLKSGNPQMVINTDIIICGIGITESQIVVVGDRKIITWELPTGDYVPNTLRNIDNSVQATEFKCPAPIKQLYASISPSLNYIAFGNTKNLPELYIHDMRTGKKLAVAKSEGWLPGFTLGGNEVWCARSNGVVDRWAIVEDRVSNNTQLNPLGSYEDPPSGFPWHSSYGYQVMDDGWILSSGGKRLLWLPSQWWPTVKVERRWNGQFLALLHSRLLEAIILELDK